MSNNMEIKLHLRIKLFLFPQASVQLTYGFQRNEVSEISLLDIINRKAFLRTLLSLL